MCDYQFSDEGLSEVTERLKEMLDIDAAEEDLDTRQEMTFEITGCDITPGGHRVCVCKVVFSHQNLISSLGISFHFLLLLSRYCLNGKWTHFFYIALFYSPGAQKNTTTCVIHPFIQALFIPMLKCFLSDTHTSGSNHQPSDY